VIDREDAELENNRAATAFVLELARSLSGSRLQIPSCPDSALRLQQALSSTDVDPAVVETIAGADPALALRVMRMANSVMLNPMGREVRELRTAISRVGYNMVRAAAVSFMVNQLVEAGTRPEPHAQMSRVWEASLHVAAFSTVIACRHAKLNPDVALLAGLLQGVGKLYILTRMDIESVVFDNEALRERILRDWHAPTARHIVQSWSLAEEIADAVETAHEFHVVRKGPIVMAEVVGAAILLAEAGVEQSLEGSEQVVLDNLPLFTRLGIDGEAVARIAREARAQLEALHAAITA
jgi:HD-like signal output (HDOD) protein